MLKKKQRNLKIGLTINFATKLFANGLQQNILFLKKLFDSIENTESFFIHSGEIPKKDYFKKDECLKYQDFIKDEHKFFDVVILMGFWLEQDILNNIKNLNKKTKFVLMQCGNQFVENSMRSIHKYEKVEYFNNSFKGIDSFWILPQHSQNASYMKTFYRTDSLSIVPYLWHPIIIEDQINNSSIIEKNTNFINDKLHHVVVLEPNLSLIKNCILPMYMVESFERKYPNKLSSLNIMGGTEIAYNKYFIRLLLELDIYKKRKNFFKVHQRYNFTESIKLFGSLIISHQLENDLNYLYFDALYLNLPLIHNSQRLKKYGYFYPHNDLDIGVEHIKNILHNHKNNISSYQKKNKEMFEIYSIENKKNQKIYLNIIEELIRS